MAIAFSNLVDTLRFAAKFEVRRMRTQIMRIK